MHDPFRSPLPALSLVFSAVALALLAPLDGTGNAQPSAGEAAVPGIREIRPGIYAIGKLQIDKTSRTIAFPGALNMEKGLLEYLLVTPHGSTHESLLVSDETPQNVHLAMLLLGAKGAGAGSVAPEKAPPPQITGEYLKHAPLLTGDPIFITVKWKADDGTEQSAPVEDWLLKADTGKTPEHGPWLYTGSMLTTEGAFVAQQQGIFAALIVNPAALINNPRKGNDNDEAWAVNEKVVPRAKTPVEILLRISSQSDAPNK